MSEHKEPIPSMIYNAAVGGHVTNSQQIIDEILNKEQSVINIEQLKLNKSILEEKEYVLDSNNGMGRVILRKNLVNEVNILTQSMINKSNTIYVIQYDFTLGEDITVPDNCILEFDGGSISNTYTITGNNTGISAGLVKIFSTNVTLAGNWNVAETYPQWFGAKGDGVTNDTDAFAAASNIINLNGGGKYVIPKGLYIVGKQDFAGETGKGYSYRPYNIIAISDCIKPVIIEGNGAVLKISDGLKYGSFDPVTGEIHNPTLPFTNKDYAAQIGYTILIEGCKNVAIRNLELDGNINNAIIGGLWGDKGRQVTASGLVLNGNDNVLVENIYTHHNGLDGLTQYYFDLTDSSPDCPHTYINVISEYNGRQSFSWCGGKKLTAINCKFNYTGKNGVVSSDPYSGVDIEAESSIIRNGLFINCEFLYNVSHALVASSGDSSHLTFFNCKFSTLNQFTLWITKPYYRFISCTIYGCIAHTYNTTDSADADKATRFESCNFIDLDPIGTQAHSFMFYDSHAYYTTLINCAIYCRSTRIGRWDYFNIQNCIINFSAGTDYLPDTQYFLIVGGAKITNLIIYDKITENIPETGYYVNGANNAEFRGYNEIVSDNTKLKWNNPTSGRAGQPYFVADHPSGTTRPTNVPSGYMFFDQTAGINKPIWWNGSAWVDATGTTV